MRLMVCPELLDHVRKEAEKVGDLYKQLRKAREEREDPRANDDEAPAATRGRPRANDGDKEEEVPDKKRARRGPCCHAGPAAIR